MLARVVVVDGGGNALHGDLQIAILATDADDGVAAIAANHVVPDVAHQCSIVRRCVIRSPVFDELTDQDAVEFGDDIADLERQDHLEQLEKVRR